MVETLIKKALIPMSPNGKIGTIFADYNKHTMNNLPQVFCTVAIWGASQSLINELVKTYAPQFLLWQVALIEIFVASFLLYAISKKKDGVSNGSVPDGQTSN